MALTPTPVPKYPDVPVADGVPAVFRAPTQPVFTALLLAADVLTVLRSFLPSEWGIFVEGGQPAVIPNSIISVDQRKEWRISDYPTEQGGFQTYNKVETPGDIRVRMAVSGMESRGPFLASVQAMCSALDLLTIVTPDAVYDSMNAIHYDYRREQRSGASLLQVDVWFEEVRVTAQTQFTNTKSPEGSANASGGNVQGVPPTPAQSRAIVDAGRVNIESTGLSTTSAPVSESLT
jgi:hypothetical protein